MHSISSLFLLLFHASIFFFFFFNDTATTEIYTLSLHDALPISPRRPPGSLATGSALGNSTPSSARDRKSTRLNSSHLGISYAVFCLKKKKKQNTSALFDSHESAIVTYACRTTAYCTTNHVICSV